LLRRKNFPDLILRFLYAVRVLWMGIERLGERPWLLLLHGLHFFKERDKRRRIVSRPVHVLDAQIVRLGLEPARELQNAEHSSDARSLVARVSNPATHENQWDRCHLQQRRPRLLSRRMA